MVAAAAAVVAAAAVFLLLVASAIRPRQQIVSFSRADGGWDNGVGRFLW